MRVQLRNFWNKPVTGTFLDKFYKVDLLSYAKLPATNTIGDKQLNMYQLTVLNFGIQIFMDELK